MSTIERVLQTEQTETEFFNQKRAELGKEPIVSRVTKIREGLPVMCGENCRIHQVGLGWFSEQHGENCTVSGMAGKLETVGKGGAGNQACAGLRDSDGTRISGLLILNGLFPHEMDGFDD